MKGFTTSDSVLSGSRSSYRPNVEFDTVDLLDVQ